MKIRPNFLGLGVRALTYDDFFKKIDSWLSGKNGRSYHVALINAFCAVSNLFRSKTGKDLQWCRLDLP
jgi:hypothetical protein